LILISLIKCSSDEPFIDVGDGCESATFNSDEAPNVVVGLNISCEKYFSVVLEEELTS
jgi:hypothetical protein